MLTWKVWANDEDLAFEGSEPDARAFIVDNRRQLPISCWSHPMVIRTATKTVAGCFWERQGSGGRTGLQPQHQ